MITDLERPFNPNGGRDEAFFRISTRNLPVEVAELARRGYPIFPLSRSEKKPAVEGGFYAATTDPDTLADWAASRPGCDWALATGLPSGVVVIDADSPDAARVMADTYEPPDAETRRGAHWYFRHPKDGKVTSTPGFVPGPIPYASLAPTTYCACTSRHNTHDRY